MLAQLILIIQQFLGSRFYYSLYISCFLDSFCSKLCVTQVPLINFYRHPFPSISIKNVVENGTKRVADKKTCSATVARSNNSSATKCGSENLMPWAYSEIWLYGNRRFRARVPIYREFPYSQMHVIAKSDF